METPVPVRRRPRGSLSTPSLQPSEGEEKVNVVGSTPAFRRPSTLRIETSTGNLRDLTTPAGRRRRRAPDSARSEVARKSRDEGDDDNRDDGKTDAGGNEAPSDDGEDEDKEAKEETHVEEKFEDLPILTNICLAEKAFTLSILRGDSSAMPPAIHLPAALTRNNEGVTDNTIKSLETSIELASRSNAVAVMGRPAEGFYASSAPVLIPLLAGKESAPIAQQARMTSRLIRNYSKAQERNAMLAAIAKATEPSAAELLQLRQGVPLLRRIENPVSDTLMDLVIPTPTMAYGGQIGQWTELATSLDRYGPLLGSGGQKSLTRSILRIHVHRVKILNHPLFSEEQTAYAELIQHYAVYSKLMHSRYLDFLSARLTVIVERLSKLISRFQDADELSAEDHGDIQALYHDLLNTLAQTHAAKIEYCSVSVKMHAAWERVKRLRKEKGFTNTIGSLICRRLKYAGDPEDDGADTQKKKRRAKDKEGDDAETRVRQSEESIDSAVMIVSKLVKDTIAVLSKLEASGDASEGDSRLAEQRKWVSAVIDKIKSSELTPKYVFKLVGNCTVTPNKEVIDAAERRRRHDFNCFKYRCVLRLKDKIITKSRVGSLNTSSIDGTTFDIMQSFEFQVFNQPQNMYIDILYSKGGLMDPSESLGGTSRLMLPGRKAFSGNHIQREVGDSASGFAPIAGWFVFSEVQAKLAAKKDTFFSLLRRRVDEAPMEGMVFCVSEYKPYGAKVGADEKENVSFADRIHGEVAVANIAAVPLSQDKSVESSSKARTHQKEETAPLLPLPAPVPVVIDYNDPSYFETLETAPDRRSQGNDRFFLLGDNILPCPYEEAGDYYINYIAFQENARMALLRIREQKPHLFTGPLPLQESEILQSPLYRSILAGKDSSAVSDDVPLVMTTGLAPRDPRSQFGNALFKQEAPQDPSATSAVVGLDQKQDRLFDFLRRVRDSHTAVNRRAKRNVFTNASVVLETDYMPPPAEDAELVLVPPRKRALKPQPTVRTPQSVQVSRCDVLIQVLGAKNVPQRVMVKEELNATKERSMKADAEKDVGGKSKAAYDDTIIDPMLLSEDVLANRNGVRSFVEIRLQENSVVTTATEGMSPIWRQSLSLVFKAPQDDYSSSAMAQVRDELTLNLFDEVVEDDSHRGGFLEGESTWRTEKRFLGSMTIPITTIVEEGKIEGSFRMDAPISNFGYSLKSQINRRVQANRNDRMFIGREEDKPENNVPVAASSWLSTLPVFLKDMLASRPSEVQQQFDFNEYISEGVLKEFGFFASGNAATFINVMVTMDPLLPPPASASIRPVDKLPPASCIARSPGNGGHETALLSHARNWLNELAAIGPHTKKRNYAVFGVNSTGHSVFIPRYLCTNTNVPAGFTTRRSLVHLVSRLPFIPDAQAFIGESDLWCTIKQTLDIGAGDEEEHATMLFNLLAALHSKEKGSPRTALYPSDDAIAKESLFLVLGSALPEGDTVYVIIKDSAKAEKNYEASAYLVINPTTGYIYSAADPQCPLRKVFTLVTPYNIFANIQPNDEPWKLEFNVGNAAHWKPFYGARLPFPSAGLPSVQTPMEYSTTSASYCLEIENTLKTVLKSQMRKWRSRRKRSITTFHPDASAAMYDMLALMESWKRTGEIQSKGDRLSADDLEYIEEQTRSKLKTILRTRSIKGYPMNIPFTDVEDVLRQIKGMCIHESLHPEVQFVFAARAFPLVNNLVSLWIFIGTLEAL